MFGGREYEIKKRFANKVRRTYEGHNTKGEGISWRIEQAERTNQDPANAALIKK